MPKLLLRSSGVSHWPGWIDLFTILFLSDSRLAMALGVVPAGYCISWNRFSGSRITSPALIFALATRTGTVFWTELRAVSLAVRYAATRPQPMATNIITNVFDFIAAPQGWRVVPVAV